LDIVIPAHELKDARLSFTAPRYEFPPKIDERNSIQPAKDDNSYLTRLPSRIEFAEKQEYPGNGHDAGKDEEGSGQVVAETGTEIQITQ